MSARRAVVIGSGVSGLAAGCLLAEAGFRTVVLEQHSVAGGLLQRFRRKGIAFDTGFHYVGGAGAGGPLERYFRRLGILHRLRLTPLNEDAFDIVHLPGRTFSYPVGAARIADAFRRAFPAEGESAARHLARLTSEAAGHPLFSFASASLGTPGPREAGTVTLSESLRACGVRDPELRALLGAHSLLYGVPADRAPLEAHALVCASYYHSAHSIEGGGEALVRAFVERLEELGGELRLRSSVERIVVKDRVARGVELKGGEILDADCVIATTHPRVTGALLAGADLPARRLRRIAATTQTPGAMLVHAVARGVPPDAARSNHIRFNALEYAWTDVPDWIDGDGPPPVMAILPADAIEGPSGNEVATPRPGEAADSTVFQVLCPTRWVEGEGTRERWRERKASVAARVVPAVEECVPAWRGRIEVVDVSTPIAMRHFVRSPEGSCYGAECSVEQWGPRRPSSHVGIAGLRMAGQSIGLPGVLGCIVTAFVAAASETGGLEETYKALRGWQSVANGS